MSNVLRLAPALCAALVALGLAGPAAAAYKPKLVAAGSGADTSVHVTWPDANDPTQAVTLYVPSAYTIGTPAVGARIGAAQTTMIEKVNGNARVRRSGAMTAGDPASTPLRAAATECTLNPLHEQVWMATLSVGGSGQNPVALTVFADRTTPAEAVLGGIKLQFCFRSPDVSEGQGGALRGGKPVDVRLTIAGTLNAPTTAGDFLWHGLFTPYVPGTKTANRSGTVEAQSILRVPRTVTLKAKRIAKTRRVDGKRRTTYSVRLTGQVSEGGKPLGGASVRVLRNGRRVANVKTNEDAGFSVTLALRTTASFRVRAIVKERTTSCQGTPVAPAGCTGAAVSGFITQSKGVSVKKPNARRG
jgi:hypothetical protein